MGLPDFCFLLSHPLNQQGIALQSEGISAFTDITSMLPNLIVVLYALLPVALLTSASLPSGVFYALIAASLALLVQKRFAGAAEQTYRYRWLIASYSVLFLSVAVSSIYYGDWAGANSEGALRFFLGLWVLLLALPHINPQKLKHSLWGVLIAGLVSTIILLSLIASGNPRPLTPGLILTTYSSIMLLLGAISVYALKWQLTPWPKSEGFLKVLVALATFAAFIFAQTRTGLLGLPLFIVLGVAVFVGLKRWARAVTVVAIACAIMLAIVFSNDALRGRIAVGISEVVACKTEEGYAFSSMCIRIQLWQSALEAGVTHPWVGLGDGGRYGDYLEHTALPKGLVAQSTVDIYFGEPHNDVLLMLAAFGLPGAIGLLLIYFAPCFYFLPRLLGKEVPTGTRAAAAMGLAVCLGFFLFGLPETMFRRMNTMGFYVAFVALFVVMTDYRIASKRCRYN
ncbi:O-antigen ligase [Pusillimonas sp. NJUB218]|uniref:O-antigen ligase family protein n=1 Tax=Pusillimonas sp. NJUB218 TaxID=2023230 RepID=UPI000F4BF9A2|nr:O-antigen ligase family protein [Pusillimonas sp. NJUB218]ROT44031.1 hypothetical protein CHR62_14515 [Pusillimonas sp. NJUB218]